MLRLGFLLLLISAGLGARTAAAQEVLLEAEQFASLGGWDLDQQSMDQMGSPYLLAHGLGTPVKDAVTTARFPQPGRIGFGCARAIGWLRGKSKARRASFR